MRWIVAAVTVFLAAISIPYCYQALQSSRQKRTMADLRLIATAIEALGEDRKSYAIGPASKEIRIVPWAALERALIPAYTRRLPREDAWGNPYHIYVNDRHYVIRSVGSDGRAEGQRYIFGNTMRFEDDLVFAEGSFIRAPEGL